MNLPSHPPHTDNEQATTRLGRRARVIVPAIVVVALLASIHLLRTALG